jgi:hypothetical protein
VRKLNLGCDERVGGGIRWESQEGEMDRAEFGRMGDEQRRHSGDGELGRDLDARWRSKQTAMMINTYILATSRLLRRMFTSTETHTDKFFRRIVNLLRQDNLST